LLLRHAAQRALRTLDEVLLLFQIAMMRRAEAPRHSAAKMSPVICAARGVAQRCEPV